MIDKGIFFSSLSFAAWVYLALFRGRFWQPKPLEASPEPDAWPDIDIIIPARDEADNLQLSLPSLLAQDYPGTFRIILVDDHSTDGTADVARAIGARRDAARLTVIAAPDLPQGWNGKVAAMQAGVVQSKASHILFTDADIWHPPGSLRKLAARAVEQKLDLVSLMVKLHCEDTSEKLLIPAFVFFFAMLYPFDWVSNTFSSTAAAAGGVMLVNRATLDERGGLEFIKSELIDDCALARLIKKGGGRIELGFTQDVRSLRIYDGFQDIERMVARTAFTQLHHSPALLALTVFGMGLLFLLPLLMLLTGSPSAMGIGLVAWFAMTLLYVPMVLFYRLSPVWALTLPFAAAFYIGATIDSARLYWQGKGGQWKGRAQA